VAISDHLLFDRPDQVLWISRRGEVLEDRPALRRSEGRGGFWGAGEFTCANDHDFPDISDLGTVALRGPWMTRPRDWRTTLGRLGFALPIPVLPGDCALRREP
jgi:hypothetical protein